MIRILNSLERLVFEASRARLLLALFAALIVKTGVWAHPSMSDFLSIARDPFVKPSSDPMSDAIFSSWLGPFLAWFIGATSEVSLVVFFAVFAAAFTTVFVWLLFARLPEHLARIALVVFFALPVSGISWFWIGPDGITLFLLTLALVASAWWPLALAIGVALGMHHFETGVLASGSLLVALALQRALGQEPRVRISFPVALLLGACLGRGLLTAIFAANDIEMTSGRLYYMSQAWPIYVGFFVFHFPTMMFGVLGVGWLAVARHLDLGRRSLPFVLSFGLLCLLVPLVGDVTRNLGTATFLLVAQFVLLDPRSLSVPSRREVAALLFIWLIVPWGFLWGPKPLQSAFPYDVALGLNRVFDGGFGVPDHWKPWPFQ